MTKLDPKLCTIQFEIGDTRYIDADIFSKYSMDDIDWDNITILEKHEGSTYQPSKMIDMNEIFVRI